MKLTDYVVKRDLLHVNCALPDAQVPILGDRVKIQRLLGKEAPHHPHVVAGHVLYAKLGTLADGEDGDAAVFAADEQEPRVGRPVEEARRRVAALVDPLEREGRVLAHDDARGAVDEDAVVLGEGYQPAVRAELDGRDPMVESVHGCKRKLPSLNLDL